MSRYFDQHGSEEDTKELLAPDYSEAECPKEEDEDDDDDSITDIDEGQEDEIINSKEEETKVVITSTFGTVQQATPFGNPVTPTPTWGTGTASATSAPFTGPTWGAGAATATSTPNFWAQSGSTTGPKTWGTGSTTPTWGTGGVGQQSGKVEIDRSKKVIITDFLDIIAETYQSNGCPGLIPRDVYDLKPRLDVWSKLAAFTPEKIYIISPINLVPGTSGIPAAWEYTFGYYCVSLSSFLRLPFQSCQVIAQNMIGVPKESIIKQIVENPEYPINKNEVVCIGINSGRFGQGNQDFMAAQMCGIDYVDLGVLLTSMY